MEICSGDEEIRRLKNEENREERNREGEREDISQEKIYLIACNKDGEARDDRN